MFIVLGGLSPEIQFNTRVIYTLKKLALSPSKNILSRTAEPIGLKFCTIMHWPKALSGKLFLWRVRQPRASYARKTCFWGSRKSCFSQIKRARQTHATNEQFSQILHRSMHNRTKFHLDRFSRSPEIGFSKKKVREYITFWRIYNPGIKLYLGTKAP